MTITLYDCATAPSPRRARILLAEKGIAHETVQVDLRSGEQLGEAYRTLNPQCTVPALRTDDGLLLADNPAIAAWAEARFPEPPLFGRTPADKAEIASWQWRVEFEGLMPVAEALRNSSPAMVSRALPGARPCTCRSRLQVPHPSCSHVAGPPLGNHSTCANDRSGTAHDRQLAEVTAAEESLKLSGRNAVGRDWVDSTRKRHPTSCSHCRKAASRPARRHPVVGPAKEDTHRQSALWAIEAWSMA